MDQVKFVAQADYITSDFLKVVFHKFYLVNSLISWLVWCPSVSAVPQNAATIKILTLI